MKYNTNSIRHIQGIALGRPGSGKTTVANCISNYITAKYGRNNVNCVYTDGDLSTLLHSVDDKLVNFLYIDDFTLIEVDKNTLRDYFRIRHIIEENCGRNHGLVITLLGLHRFYNTPVPVRTNFDFLMFRSAPSNDYDKRFIKQYIKDEGLSFLQRCELERNLQPNLYDITLTWIKGIGYGVLRTPQPLTQTLRKINSSGFRTVYFDRHIYNKYNKLDWGEDDE